MVPDLSSKYKINSVKRAIPSIKSQIFNQDCFWYKNICDFDKIIINNSTSYTTIYEKAFGDET